MPVAGKRLINWVYVVIMEKEEKNASIPVAEKVLEKWVTVLNMQES
jgi:hypothetical protein